MYVVCYIFINWFIDSKYNTVVQLNNNNQKVNIIGILYYYYKVGKL